MDIIDAVFRSEGIGYLQRTTGAGGGVKYIPARVPMEEFAILANLFYPECKTP